MHYILAEDGKTPTLVPMLVWARWFGQADRLIAQHMAGEHITVSTVFLGLDHRFSGEGPPILWESMVFDARIPAQLPGGRLSPWGSEIDSRRYSAHDDALAGHIELLRQYRQQEDQQQAQERQQP